MDPVPIALLPLQFGASPGGTHRSRPYFERGQVAERTTKEEHRRRGQRPSKTSFFET
jgi:hypothetical protein